MTKILEDRSPPTARKYAVPKLADRVTVKRRRSDAERPEVTVKVKVKNKLGTVLFMFTAAVGVPVVISLPSDATSVEVTGDGVDVVFGQVAPK